MHKHEWKQVNRELHTDKVYYSYVCDCGENKTVMIRKRQSKNITPDIVEKHKIDSFKKEIASLLIHTEIPA